MSGHAELEALVRDALARCVTASEELGNGEPGKCAAVLDDLEVDLILGLAKLTDASLPQVGKS